MIGLMIAAVVGFIAEIVLALVFPIGFWINRFLAYWMGPAEFRMGGETRLMGPDDHLVWERRGEMPSRPRSDGNASGRP